MNHEVELTAEAIETTKLYRELGLSDDEYEQVKTTLGRLPNYLETGLFSAMWSEHCSYKSSKVILKQFPTSGEIVIQGPGEGAGVIDIGDDQALVFKIESHNSPSAGEPFHGAATGVGGILRDVFSMGARPIAVLNSLRFGELSSEHDRYLFKHVVKGIAYYANTMGVPAVGGEIQFEDAYASRPLVNAMAVGLINHTKLQTGKASGVGNSVIYVGAKTGRDGIHGATFSSVGKAEEGTETIYVKGNPALQKKVMEACLELASNESLIGMQDMGAAGLTSSASEMASKAGTGMELHLDKVPVCDDNMTPYEIMLSESQERMLIVVKAGKEQEVQEQLAKWDIISAHIGTVTDDKQFRLLFNGEIVADVPVDALAEDSPVYNKSSKEPDYYRLFQEADVNIPKINNIKDTFLQLLAQPTIASKEWVYEQFNTDDERLALKPGASAGIVRIGDSNKGVALTTDGNSRYIYLDPITGGKIAVAEAARNIVCTGARPLAITDGLNYGNPDDPEVFWQMERSVKGISEACRAFDTPVVSGNVSLYNEVGGKSVYPTPIIGMVGVIQDLTNVTTIDFKDEGDLIYIIGETKPEFGGSELQKLVTGEITGKPPAIDLDVERKRQEMILHAIEEKLITSAIDLSEGGLATAIAEACVSGGKGADIVLTGDAVTALFSESQGRYLVSITQSLQARFEETVQAIKIGEVTSSKLLSVKNENGELIFNASIEELEQAWKQAIPTLMTASR